MNGGPSHVDTFDPKPMLTKYAGKELPTGTLRTERRTGAALPSPFKFRRYGQSGIEVSDLFSRTAQSIDDIAVIRSMHADVPNHEPSLMLMNCGDARQIRPSIGSWLCYGLGSENQNLPAFVAMCPNGYPIQETQNWQAGFLPGVYEGTYIDTKHTAIEQLIEHIRNDRIAAPSSASSSTCCTGSTPGIGGPAGRCRPRSPHPVVRARLPHADRGGRGVRCQPRAEAHPRHVRPRRAGPADSDCPPAG